MVSAWCFFAIMYALYWSSQWISHVYCRLGSPASQRLSRFVWNRRIDMFQRPLYRAIVETMEDRRYWVAAGFVILANARMVLLKWVFGLFLLAPLVAAFSGTMAGALFSQGERRTIFPYGILNMVFEWAAFAAGAAAGLSTTWSWSAVG